MTKSTMIIKITIYIIFSFLANISSRIDNIQYQNSVYDTPLTNYILVFLIVIVVVCLIIIPPIIINYHKRTKFLLNKLQKQDEKFDILLDNNRDACVVTNINGKILKTNQAFRNMLGFSEEELKGKNILHFTPVRFHKIEKDIIQNQLVKNGYKDVFEKYLIDSKNKEIPVEISLFICEIETNEKLICGFARDISERKKLESEIKENENYLKLILNSTAESIVVIDINQKVTFINNSAKKILGYTNNEILNQKFHDLIKHSGPEGIIIDENDCPVRKTIINGNEHHEEGIFYSKAGAPLYVEYWSYPVRNNNEITGGIITFVDISERKKILKLITDSEKRFRSLFENAPIGYILINTDFLIKEINNNLSGVLGYTKNEILHKSIYNLLFPEDADILTNFTKNLLTQKKTTGQIVRLISQKGTVFFFELEGTRTKGLNNETELHLILLNWSDQIKIEELLLKSEIKFSWVLDTIPLLAIMLSEQGNIIYCNDAFSDFSGYSKNELIGKNWFDYFLENSIKDEIRNVFQDTIKNESVPNYYENNVIIKNGETRYIAWRNIFDINEQTGVPTIISIGEDITEKNRILEELKESEERYKAIFNNDHAPMIIVNPENGKIMEVNLAAEKFYGHPIQNMKNMFIWDINSLPQDEIKMRMKFTIQNRSINARFTHRTASGLKEVDVVSGPIRFNDQTYLYSIIQDASEKARYEIAIKTREQQLKALFENMLDGISLHKLIFDENGYPNDFEYIEINKKFEEILNIQRKDIIGKKYSEIFPEVLHNRSYNWLELFSEVVINNKSLNIEYEAISLNRWFGIVAYSPQKDYFVTVFQDITQKKRIEKINEQIIKESAQTGKNFFKSVVETLAEIFRADVVLIGELINSDEVKTLSLWLDNKINENIYYNLTGTPCENVIGKETCIYKTNVSTLFPEDTFLKELNIQAYIGVPLFGLRHNPLGIIVLLFKSKFDDEELIKTFLNMFSGRIAAEIERLNSEKHLIEYHKQLENIVDKRTLQLKESEEKFRKLSENSNDLIIRLDNELRHLYVNPIVEELLGYSNSQFIGKSFSELEIGGLTIDEWEKNVKNVFITHEEVRFELELPNGRWIDWIIIPEFDSNSNVITVLAYGRDITSLKELEKTITTSLTKERELNELKSRFISTTSHEFRTPLTSILSSAELIKLFGKNWDEDKYNLYIDKIINSVESLTELLDDILIISRADSGKLTLNLGEINIYKLLIEIIEESKIYKKEKQALILDLPEQEKMFSTDEKLLKQIISNILSNAFKYTSFQGEIKLSALFKNNQLILEISDNGSGISDEELKFIFEPFFRAKNSENIIGTGLGLSIVKRAVELLQGNIEVKSTPREGSLFIITLPELLSEELNEKNSNN